MSPTSPTSPTSPLSPLSPLSPTTDQDAPGRARAVRRIAVAGAGLMGSGIAAELALRLPEVETVRRWDPAPGVADRAVAGAAAVAEALGAAGVLDAELARARLARLGAAGTIEGALEGAEYVAEAAPEDLPLKQALFARLDAVAAPEAV